MPVPFAALFQPVCVLIDPSGSDEDVFLLPMREAYMREQRPVRRVGLTQPFAHRGAPQGLLMGLSLSYLSGARAA